MGTATEIRKWIDDYKKFKERNEKFELLVSYDCSNQHHPFRAKLHTLLVSTMKSHKVNESLYRLSSKINLAQIQNLAETIEDLFQDVLLESKTEPSVTNVQFILPEAHEFSIHTIINT